MKIKRILALVLSLLMVFGGSASVFAADAAEAAETESPYLAAAKALDEIGVLKGDGEDYKLEDDVTRWQMALFVSRIVTGEVDDAYWGKVATNTSKFTDITGTASNYLGAIGFASQKGIINGWNDAKTGALIFNPEGGITYQDALTMATRALGYTGLSYPWGNIEKAVELGLDKGIVEVGYEDELTRGEVVQVLYNTLCANTVRGICLREEVFGLTEAVIVIVASEDVVYTDDNEELNRDNYVSFQRLGADGKPTGKVYSVSAKTLGIEDTDAAVGDTYFVTTTDKFENIVSYEKSDSETLWNLGVDNLEFQPKTFNKDTKKEYSKLVILNAEDEDDVDNNYNIVKEYTYLRTLQGSKTGEEAIPGDLELLVYDPSQLEAKIVAGQKYYTDAWGNILAFVKNETTGAYSFEKRYIYNAWTDSFFKEVTREGVTALIPVTDEEIAKDADVIVKDSTTTTTYEKVGFKQLTSLSDYAYASLKLVDDYTRYEGYDRGIYKAYGLMQYDEYTSNGTDYIQLKYNDGGLIKDGMNKTYFKDVKATDYAKYYSIVDAVTGKDVTLKDGAFFLGYYNYQTNTIEVLEILDVEVGVVKGWKDSGKVTIGSETYDANYTTLKHSAVLFSDNDKKAANVSSLLSLYNTSVKYITVDDQIIYIANDTTGNEVVVLDAFVGVTTSGNLEFYAYSTAAPGSKIKIQVASVNNYYLGYNNLYNNYNLVGLLKTPLTASVDSKGVYYVGTTAPMSENVMTFNQFGTGYFASTAVIRPDTKNGVKYINATNSTYYVFIDTDASSAQNVITTAKGIPADYAKIGENGKAKFYYASDKMVIADITGAGITAGAFNTSTQFTYVFVPSDYTVYGSSSDESFNTGVFAYSKLFNMKTGATETYKLTSAILSPNKIYKAVDGVLTELHNPVTLAEAIKALDSLTSVETGTVVVPVAGGLSLKDNALKNAFIRAAKEAIVTVDGAINSVTLIASMDVKKGTEKYNEDYGFTYSDLDRYYTISYVYDKTTLKAVVYITDVATVNPMPTGVTTQWASGPDGEQEPTATGTAAAVITGDKSSITWKYISQGATFTNNDGEAEFELMRQMTIKGITTWVPVGVDGQDCSVVINGTTAVITFLNEFGLPITLEAGNYMIRNLVIGETNGTNWCAHNTVEDEPILFTILPDKN